MHAHRAKESKQPEDMVAVQMGDEDCLKKEKVETRKNTEQHKHRVLPSEQGDKAEFDVE
jgi:hypothetical protein